MITENIFKAIRICHLSFAKKDLPDHIALYFHNVEKHDLKTLINILNYFRDLGYIVSDPNSYLNSSKKSLFVSFDDNYFNWLNISEILAENGYKAVFYTNTGPIKGKNTYDKKGYFTRINYYKDDRTLSYKDIQTIHHEYKQIIGGHSTNHFNLAKLPKLIAEQEILQNKMELEAIIGQNIIHFSYPYGMRRYFNTSLRQYCKQIGYETIANAIPGLLFKEKDAYNINRTMWNLNKGFYYNLNNIKIDGRFFEFITGKSPIG